jgi:hypothetical protein
MGNAIAGRVHLELDGKRRTLACDMNAGEVLYEKHGDHWTLWLIERFVGRPVYDGGKPKKIIGYQREKFPPSDEVSALYALLATDREDSGVDDDEKSLRRCITLVNRNEVKDAITRAVLASFGVPGEDLEVVVHAADAPPGTVPAPTHGIGTQF